MLRGWWVDGGFQKLHQLCTADVKNIAGEDHVTLTIVMSFEIYI